MDDGPMPMKNGKPAPLNPNSVDQFNETHQGEHEARARNAEAKDIDEVIQDNMACPKLMNELDRRRSVVEVKACNTQRNNSKRKCNACEKLKQLTELKRLKLKPKCSSDRSRSVSRRRKTGDRRNQRIKRIRTIQKRTRGPNKRKVFRLQNVSSDKNKDDKSVASGASRESGVSSLKNPDSTDLSISSYETYPSMDHEPMD